MKIIISLFMLFAVTSSCYAHGETIFSIEGETITPIEEFLNRYDSDSAASTEYNYNIKMSAHTAVDNTLYNIGFGIHYLCKEGDDPGYHVVEIKRGDDVVFVLRDLEIIPYNYDLGQYGKDFRNFATSEMFIEVPLPQDAKALVFIGWPFSTDLPHLMIVVLTKNDAKLVYSKNMIIKDIVKEMGVFLMQLQSNYQYMEYKDGMEIGLSPATTHTMWLEDGVLKFRDNANN